MKNKKVLVLMSSYNGEKFILEQINSILNQETKHQVNLLIRDDGSTDGTIKILKEITSINPRVKALYGSNKGVNESFFELIEVANDADYYAFSDQDDVWMLNKIESAISKIMNIEKDYSGPILYGGCSYITDQDLNILGITTKQTKKITLKNTIIQNFLPGHSQIFNVELLKILKKNTNLKVYMYDAWITNVATLYGKLIFDNSPHTYYRQHDKNVLGSKGESHYIAWISERLKRIKKEESKQYGKQISLYYNLYKKDIINVDREEIELFLTSRDKIIKRIMFIFKTNLYRQSTMQTFLFKILYMIGGYNFD